MINLKFFIDDSIKEIGSLLAVGIILYPIVITNWIFFISFVVLMLVINNIIRERIREEEWGRVKIRIESWAHNSQFKIGVIVSDNENLRHTKQKIQKEFFYLDTQIHCANNFKFMIISFNCENVAVKDLAVKIIDSKTEGDLEELLNENKIDYYIKDYECL